MNLSFNPSQVQFTRVVIELKKQFISKFQSLTGSIHTNENPQIHQLYQNRFQSLTGSIHTKDKKMLNLAFSLFQSLTGSIHTCR